MNNFVFGSGDPLLYSGTIPRTELVNESDIKKQLDSVMSQYQQLQQNKHNDTAVQKDWIGDFDNMLKGLDTEIIGMLSENEEFTNLNASLQQDIQNEIMNTIKWNLNVKNEIVMKVKRLTDIIEEHNKIKANKDKQQMAEITEYLQHYSDMTFNEYKQLKESTNS